MFYAPRGFLIDYHNLELLTTFTKEIKKFAEERNAIFIKIDPYVMYKEHDLNGDLVSDGIDNSDTVDNLKSLGYHHFGFNLMQDTLQPRWMHTITVKNRSLDDVMKDMEIFAPVIPVCTFDTLEEALEIANQSKFGLCHS